MKKTLLICTLILVMILVFKGADIINTLILFILVGALPGTTYALSPSLKLSLLTLTAVVIISYIVAPSVFATINPSDLPEKKRKTRRRFSEI